MDHCDRTIEDSDVTVHHCDGSMQPCDGTKYYYDDREYCDVTISQKYLFLNHAFQVSVYTEDTYGFCQLQTLI